ncbi:potassium channel subfamily K member 1-like isoform X1 [Teleopsis dalmanni]|uniref:potassium channel subfamily K member 1-like isoform X1 n=1 Tax=Teleopsis dalmanni TaxID=139649 RepID=UPI0018CE693D|nr:potassium channel subfamily K member 1-like isoform X1 [Teleopsis dalmanni]
MTSERHCKHSGYESLDGISNQSPSTSSHVHNSNDCLTQNNKMMAKDLSRSDTAIHLQPQMDNICARRISSVISSINISSFSLNSAFQNSRRILLNNRGCDFESNNGAKCQNETKCTNPFLKLKRKINRHHFLILFVLFYVAYLTFGGFCFQMFETPIENNYRAGLNSLRNDFLKKYPQILDEDLEDFLHAIITANDRGISPLRNASNEMNWSFGQALFFSSTVVTTIGYGRVTPLSQTGKIFCIIYATIGIPLTLLLLSAMVERLLMPANWLLGTLNSKLGHLYQPFNIRLLHLSIVVAIVAAIFFAIPTAIFAYLEPAWGTLDAFYYCFISLTTIGLGDYIPGEGVSIEHRSIYKMFITGYLICGLIAMMFVLTIFYDIPQLNLGQLFTESVNGETEKLRLSSNNTTCYSGPSGLYMPQRDEDTRRAVVRIRPHGDDSPSPDEAPSSLNSDMRIP